MGADLLRHQPASALQKLESRAAVSPLTRTFASLQPFLKPVRHRPDQLLA